MGLLICVFCLVFPVYAPEAQDSPGGVLEEPIENLTTVAARQEALAAHLKSAGELRGAGELVKAARALNKAGHLQLALSRPDDALATFQESRQLTDQSGDAVIKVDTLNGIGAAYLHQGKYEDAIPLLEEAGRISEQNNYLEGRAEALLLLSDGQNYTDHPPALKTAQDALALWQSTGNNRGIIRAHLSIAAYQLALNSLEECTQSNETALTLARNAGFKLLQAEALINFAFIEYRRGAWQNMTRFLSDAEKLVDHPDAEPVTMTQITSSIAEAYIQSGLPEIGLPRYQEALEYVRKANRPRDEIVIGWGVARTLYFARKYPEALVALQAALAEAELQKQPVVMAMCHEFLGRTHHGMNDRESALSHLERAHQLYSDTATPMEAARVRALIGQVYETSGRVDEARGSYQEAMRTFDALSDRVNQSATLFALGRLEMKAGNYDKAEVHLRQSIEMTDNMRRLSSSRDLTAAFSATVHDRYEQYVHCLMRNDRGSSASQRAVLAFETSESARARSLAELLRVSGTNLLSNIDPELAAQQRSLRHLLRVKEDERVSLLATNKKDELEKLDAELEKLGTDYKNVLAAIKARYPAYEQITQTHGWDLGRIQREVISDDDTVLLEYFLGAEKSYVWAITRTGFTSRELQSEMVIRKAVQTLYDLVKQKPTSETKGQLDGATRELAQLVLAPVADQLNKRQIIVAADGALNYIPFQMLPASSTNPEPLLVSHEIINTPSASILGELRKEAASRGVRTKALAIFGNPMFGAQNKQPQSEQRSIELKSETFDLSSFGRLFYAAREIAHLLDVASAAQTFAATDYDATRDQLLSTDLTPYAILHFATHGLLDPKRPEKSGLLLSTVDREGKVLNGFVGLQDVYSLRAPVDLVVLSACETGLGKDIRGEGMVGLTRGFMYAGSTSVVASLWKVQDHATAELMKHFYTEMLENGKTPAAALRSAQDSIRQMPEWSDPHYWAGFTLQGEYRYVVNSSRGWQVYQVVLLVTLGLGLLAASLYVYRRLATKST
jgi:CHAT domain-containing protein/tetratricopeptide (TPR) repeat protein